MLINLTTKWDGKYELPNITQIWVDINIIEIESIINIRNFAGLESFKCEFYQNFKEEIISIFTLAHSRH